MAIVYADQKTFDNEVNSSEIVLVDFYADWCGPCRAIAPILEEMDNERMSVKIVKVNVDNAPEIAKKFGIMSIPTLMIFKHGKEVHKKIGLCSKEAIMDMIQL